MHRLFVPAFVVPTLLSALAVPAAAAPPLSQTRPGCDRRDDRDRSTGRR